MRIFSRKKALHLVLEVYLIVPFVMYTSIYSLLPALRCAACRAIYGISVAMPFLFKQNVDVAQALFLVDSVAQVIGRKTQN